jgi:hypothetical protein
METTMDTRHPGPLSHRSSATPTPLLSRRTALQGAALAGASLALLAAGRSLVAPVRAAQQEGPPPEWFAPNATRGGHGQVIVGEGPVYLSHLPMFMFDTPKTHPHHYQVILEVSLPEEAMASYLADRTEFEIPPLYTLEPTEAVAMLDVILPASSKTPVTTLHGTIIRGHWERGSQRQPFGAPFGVVQEDVEATVEQVVYAHEFAFEPRALNRLEYVLFGAGEQRFLAHRITAVPDFDQILAVSIDGDAFSDAQLREGVLVAIPERRNVLGERLREGDEVLGEAWLAGTGVAMASDLALTGGRELFFEEGELRRFPLTNEDFEPTEAEIEAGFPPQ